MEIGILGPLEVRVDGRNVELAGSRLRAVLTRLAVDAPAVVSFAELVDAVWVAGPPADPMNALQSLVSRVRRAVGVAAVIQQAVGGYRLAVDRGAVDAAAFADQVAAGRRALRNEELAPARDTLAKALALWRGDPLVDAGDADYAAGSVTRLFELKVQAQSDLIETGLRLGRAAEVLPDIEALARDFPLREQLAGQQIRALAATGRTADALAAYDRLSESLADELGVDPGTELQEIRLAVLRGEIIAPAADRRPIGPRRSNLRAPLTSFIGRDDEVARVSGLLTTSRLVTVIGPGGAGKTRLASEIARQWISRRADGVWMVELAPVTDGAAIAQAMLGALGQLDTRAVDRRVERHVRPSVEQLLDLLADSDCLLLVDNCEHLIAPAADLVDQLLAACPQLLVVATSREPLGIDGEALCLLPPLGLPPVGVSATEASAHQSVRLFVERAQAVRAGFAVDDDTVGAVIDIVRRLDGLPLAIELAAARTRLMPVGEIASRLSDRFRLLTGGSRTAMPRHRTLRAVVEWSWDLLSSGERLLAERLAVFPAGATAGSAVAVCADDLLPADDVGDLLLALVDKSLLTTIDGDTPRYRMLETIREYGVERLAERGEAERARLAHATYFAQVAQRCDPVLRTAGQLEALAVLAAERDNILAALRFLAESDDPADRAASLDLALSLAWYWTMIGANADAASWLGLALAADPDSDQPDRIWAAAAHAALVMMTGASGTENVAESQAELKILADRLRASGPPTIPSLQLLSPMLAFLSGDMVLAESAMNRLLQSPDGWVRAAARVNRAWFAENEGDIDGMRDDIDSAYRDFALIGDRWGLSSVLSARGMLRAQDGDLTGAIADYEMALRLAQELGATDDVLQVELRLAGMYLRSGDADQARRTIEHVRGGLDGHSGGFDRTLFAEGVLMAIELQQGNVAAATAMSAEMRDRLAEYPAGPLQAHASAIFASTTAIVAIRNDDPALALADLTTNYPVALSTADMPVMAAVGISVAWLAAALAKPEDAAAILGAAARLRGGEDRSDPLIADLIGRLRTLLGERFDEHYQGGRALDRQAALDRIDPSLLG